MTTIESKCETHGTGLFMCLACAKKAAHLGASAAYDIAMKKGIEKGQTSAKPVQSKEFLVKLNAMAALQMEQGINPVVGDLLDDYKATHTSEPMLTMDCAFSNGNEGHERCKGKAKIATGYVNCSCQCHKEKQPACTFSEKDVGNVAKNLCEQEHTRRMNNGEHTGDEQSMWDTYSGVYMRDARSLLAQLDLKSSQDTIALWLGNEDNIKELGKEAWMLAVGEGQMVGSYEDQEKFWLKIVKKIAAKLKKVK
jgi:hypothetical protein